MRPRCPGSALAAVGRGVAENRLRERLETADSTPSAYVEGRTQGKASWGLRGAFSRKTPGCGVKNRRVCGPNGGRVDDDRVISLPKVGVFSGSQTGRGAPAPRKRRPRWGPGRSPSAESGPDRGTTAEGGSERVGSRTGPRRGRLPARPAPPPRTTPFDVEAETWPVKGRPPSTPACCVDGKAGGANGGRATPAAGGREQCDHTGRRWAAAGRRGGRTGWHGRAARERWKWKRLTLGRPGASQ
jgi:hypothetical protein